MIKLESRLLFLGLSDKCGRRFSEDCKIEYPDKVPVTLNFDDDLIVGISDIVKDKDGFRCLVTLNEDIEVLKDENYNELK